MVTSSTWKRTETEISSLSNISFLCPLQLREDVTRYRYGDEQHLDEALNRIFQLGRPTGIPRKLCPVLAGVREEVVDGNYALVRASYCVCGAVLCLLLHCVF